MSGGRYIKEAVIAALCEHPDRDKYGARAFSGDNLSKVMDALANESHNLTKADFLTPDEKGNYIIDTPGFWKNLGAIQKILDKNGEKFTLDDFTKVIRASDDRTLLESAEQHGGLKNLFSFDIWKGRFDEMERLWFIVPIASRRATFEQSGFIDAKLKRDLLAHEGKTMPEDGIVTAGITVGEVFEAFNKRGDFEDINRRLKQNGDYFRKDYALLRDSDGDTLFRLEAAWSKYDDVVKTMAQHGERFEVADFIRKTGTRANMLQRAVESHALPKLFTPEHWADRLPDMLDLWSHLKPAWKAGSLKAEDFDRVYAEAESLTYGKLVDFGNLASKQDLLQPVNVPSAKEKPVLPIGLKSFWDNLPLAEQSLSAKGEKITVDDLRVKTGQMENSALMIAAKFNAFDKVIELARKNGESLSLDDMLTKDHHGNTLLNILADKRQLGLAFSPDLWAGRVEDMRTLWTHVRSNDRPQVDILQAEVAAKQATLKKQSKGKFKLGGGPK